jgi:hypothetical protein
LTDVNAEVIADSITPWGERLTSIQVTFHRFVLAEFNTHCVFSRNSASSRAIPVEKQLDRFSTDPALPVVWPREQKGMSGGSELGGEALLDAINLFAEWRGHTQALIANYLKNHPEKSERLHKSLINRLMEPMQWHTALVTASAWENFFFQRCHPAAQPEMRAAAEAIRDVMKNSVPTLLEPGQWHMPYLDADTIVEVTSSYPNATEVLKQISAARCARTSYMTQEGIRDPEEDLNLYARLLHVDQPGEPLHASPLEHLATPCEWNLQKFFLYEGDSGVELATDDFYPENEELQEYALPRIGKFPHWLQYRHEVELRQRIISFR